MAGYRLVRRIAVGDRAEVFLATPAADGGGPGEVPELVALRLYAADADAAAVAVELEALTADAGRSLPMPLDLASLPDGRTCVVVERIGGERLSQLISERTLSAGEAVTVLAPIAAGVRLLAEAGFVHPRLAASDVLFDASGRPRIIGLGALVRLDPGLAAVERSALLREGHAALSRLVAEVAAATRPASALDGALAVARSGLGARPFAPSALALEHELFRAATPLPVTGIARYAGEAGRVPARIAPEAGVRRVIAPPPIAGKPPAVPPAPDPPAEVPLPAADSAERLLEGELPLLAALRTGRWRGRLRAAVARRRGAVLVGALGGGAALVILLALVPPGTASGGAASLEKEANGSTADPGVLGSPGTPSSGDPVPEAGAGTEAPDDLADPVGLTDPAELAAVAAELLELRASCLRSGDRACLSAVVQPGSALEADDLAGLASGGMADDASFDLGTLAVSGTMGQAVLLQLAYDDAERQPASLLMVRSEAGWRLREIFD